MSVRLREISRPVAKIQIVSPCQWTDALEISLPGVGIGPCIRAAAIVKVLAKYILAGSVLSGVHGYGESDHIPMINQWGGQCIL